MISLAHWSGRFVRVTRGCCCCSSARNRPASDFRHLNIRIRGWHDGCRSLHPERPMQGLQQPQTQRQQQPWVVTADGQERLQRGCTHSPLHTHVEHGWVHRRSSPGRLDTADPVGVVMHLHSSAVTCLAGVVHPMSRRKHLPRQAPNKAAATLRAPHTQSGWL